MEVTKKAVITAGVGAVLGLVLFAILKVVWIILVSAVIAFLIGIALFPADKKQKIVIKDDIDKTQVLLNNLQKINLAVREDPYRNEEILEGVEFVIDSLVDILPSLNEAHPGTELTFVVNKMAEQYLPNLVKEYLDLSPESREGQIETVKTSLNGIYNEIKKISDLVENQQVNEFQTEAMFLKHKFFGESVEA